MKSREWFVKTTCLFTNLLMYIKSKMLITDPLGYMIEGVHNIITM